MTIHYSTSFANFLYTNRRDSKIAMILSDLRDDGHYSRFYGHVTNEEIDYLTFRSDGTISYLPSNKRNDSLDPWARTERQNGKPAKVIRKLFKVESILELGLTDKDFELFSNQFKSAFSDEGYTFELLDNTKIPEVYSMAIGQISGSNASLNSSCMNTDNTSAAYKHRFDIYTNCDKLKILILKDGKGKLIGRALVWAVSYYGAQEFLLMDRIYVVADFLYDKFLDYAKANNWLRKECYKSYDRKMEFIAPNGEQTNAIFKINMPTTDFIMYPYIDTFCFGGDGYLTNYQSATNKYCYCQTNNRRSGETRQLTEDFVTGLPILSTEAVLINRGDYRNRYTLEENTVTDYRGGIWYSQDNGIVQIDNKWYDRSSSLLLKFMGSYYLRSDKKYITEIDGVYYHINDPRVIFDDEKHEYKLREVEPIAPQPQQMWTIQIDTSTSSFFR